MPLRCTLPIVLALIAGPLFAEPPRLAFQPTGPGLYAFDTGQFKGRLKVDGKYQGLYPLIDVASGADLVHAPGVFSPYRVLTTAQRYGDAARDWPTTARLLPDGAVEVHCAAAEAHPIAMTAVYRWTTPETLDFELTVRAEHEMRQFELFLSSYFTKDFRAAVYRNTAGDRSKGAFIPVDRPPDSPSGYVMFPRDEQAVRLIRDGRWKIPPSPVDWAMEPGLAAPLAIRRDPVQGLTAAMMAVPGDCFAVSSPWNPAAAEAGGYRSLYLSLFGCDLQNGQTAHTRCRLVLGRQLSDAEVLRRYEAFLTGSK